MADPSTELWRGMLATMIRIRTFEETMEDLYKTGRVPGFLHLYIGEEAVAAGVCAALREEDYITSTHRGHGHAIAKGARPDRMAAELLGKATGTCRGKGGSMHVADFGKGMLGANGIVGGGFGIAVGAALSAKLRGSRQVAACFFGDGAANKGTFHEALNFAAIRRLPVIFVCENNQYAQFTTVRYDLPVPDVASRAAGYAMPGLVVDGNDAVAVHQAAAAAARRARSGEGPSLLEMKTFRWRGHYVGDPEKYRSREEVDSWRARCPIRRLEAALIDRGLATAAEIEAIWAAARAEMEAAVRFAEDSPLPEPAEAFVDLFAPAAPASGGTAR
jgi:TPP-dependent pyruvate/acetoin dehydrogenase alpha subunit